ncbi:unnamed protein product, partial [Prorocentrum cordatum]
MLILLALLLRSPHVPPRPSSVTLFASTSFPCSLLCICGLGVLRDVQAQLNFQVVNVGFNFSWRSFHMHTVLPGRPFFTS